MSLNAYFAFAVAKGTGVSRQIVLAAVFCSGILFLILSFLPVRAWIISSIPRSQKLATATGISLFLGFIGLKSAGIVADHPATFVTVGKLTSPPDLLAFLSLIIIIELDFRKITGSIIIGILLVAIAGFLLAVSPAPSGIISAPPSIAPTFLAIDINGLFQLGATTIMIVVLSFLLVDLFDTAGTLIGVAYQAKMLGAQDNLPRLEPALIADSRATVIGILVSTSSTTSYIESASGVRAGGRTGLTAIAAAYLFILACSSHPWQRLFLFTRRCRPLSSSPVLWPAALPTSIGRM